MTNRIHIGTEIDIELPAHDRRTKYGFLFIHDKVLEIRDARIFDPRSHSINLLEDIDYERACRFVDGLLALMPGGETTLTKEAAQFIILEALLRKPRSLEGLIEPSKDAMREKARQMIDRLMISPVLKKMLCGKTNFSLDTKSVILARVNRAELARFDADAVALLLMAIYPGQLVVPRFGAYGRDAHTDLIEQGRLIAGVNYLDELPEKLRQAVLLIPDKVPRGALYRDAVELAENAGLRPDPLREENKFNEFINKAMVRCSKQADA